MRAADMFTAGAWLRVWAVWGERVTWYVCCQVVHDGSRVGNESIDLIYQFNPVIGQGFFSPFQARAAAAARYPSKRAVPTGQL